MIFYDCFKMFFGNVYVATDGHGVCKVALTEDDWQDYSRQHLCYKNSEVCAPVIGELKEYLDGKRQQFTVPLSMKGTVFCRKVWQELRLIPYGQVRTYAEIAAAIGQPKAYRAVGCANYQNPLPILIPCHRVIGKNGKLVGYKGDNTSLKEYLLRIEGVSI